MSHGPSALAFLGYWRCYEVVYRYLLTYGRKNLRNNLVIVPENKLKVSVLSELLRKPLLIGRKGDRYRPKQFTIETKSTQQTPL